MQRFRFLPSCSPFFLICLLLLLFSVTSIHGSLKRTPRIPGKDWRNVFSDSLDASNANNVRLLGKRPWSPANLLSVPISLAGTVLFGQRDERGVSRNVAPPAKVSLTLFRRLDMILKYALAAYCRVQTWQCAFCLSPTGRNTQHIITFDVPGLHAYIAIESTRKEIYVIFRALRNRQDIKTAAQFWKNAYPLAVDSGYVGAHVHTGFHKVWTTVKDNCWAEINKLILNIGIERWKNEDWKLVFGGYSYGGALAQLASLSSHHHMKTLLQDPSPNIEVYTFGSPRVGDFAFVQYARSTSVKNKRVVYKKDVVTHIPPQQQGYTHWGTEVWIRDPEKPDVVVYPEGDGEAANGSLSQEAWVNVGMHFQYFDLEDPEIKCRATQADLLGGMEEHH